FNEVRAGDLVLVPLKVNDTIKIGRFTDDPPFRDDEFHQTYVHCRRVQWIKNVRRADFTQDALYSIGSALTLSQPSDSTHQQVQRFLAGDIGPGLISEEVGAGEEDV